MRNAPLHGRTAQYGCRLLHPTTPQILIQDRQDVFAELRRVLAHREVADFLHDRHLGARDLARRCAACPRACRRSRTRRSAGRAGRPWCRSSDLLAQVAVDAIEVEIALEHAGPALHVHPQRLVARRRAGCAARSGPRPARRRPRRRARRAGAASAVSYQGCWKSAASSPISARNSRGVRDREVEHDAAADRAAHHHRPLELQRRAEGADQRRCRTASSAGTPRPASRRAAATCRATACRRPARGSAA